MAVIDRIEWHLNSGELSESDRNKAGTHIGMYISWIILSNLIGVEHIEYSKEALEEVRTKKITGLDFLIEMCDERLYEDDLNEEGIDFTHYYYNPSNSDQQSQYLEDYCTVFGIHRNDAYTVENTWDNFDKLKPLLDQRYREWKEC